jgi:aspartate 1-decarboxylase
MLKSKIHRATVTACDVDYMNGAAARLTQAGHKTLASEATL